MMMMTDEKSNLHHPADYGANAWPEKRDPWTIESMPPGLEDSPLDFLFADHHRQRQAVQILMRIADGEFDEEGVRNLIVFLKHDLPLHVCDEEEDFLPLLRAQCLPEDGIEPLMRRLRREHESDAASARHVIALLKGLVEGHRLDHEERETIRTFAGQLRHHLALENGVLLPIARVRMSAESLKRLSQGLKARRGGRPSDPIDT